MQKLLEISKILIQKTVTNPPHYYNGNEHCLIPLNEFNKFKKMIENINLDEIDNIQEDDNSEDFGFRYNKDMSSRHPTYYSSDFFV